ncbi:MauE/DoxX family redox-associated membrane protein [Dactylosporangium sp. NPDC006015]|uniref:MauE/DoxX family redox-associated membrane protein n=1 Tax=Dactylosporangium sp. NPDC006015 TaxID=3154576 RepID=UPI0033A9AAE0
MSYLSLGLLAALCCVFAASAWSKLRSRAAQQAFASSLRPVPLVPARHVGAVAMAATVAEAGLVLGLGAAVAAIAAGWPAARPLTVVMLALTGVLLAVFTTGVALAVRRGTRARCACFGAAERPLSARHLVRNGLLLAATAAAAGPGRPGWHGGRARGGRRLRPAGDPPRRPGGPVRTDAGAPARLSSADPAAAREPGTPVRSCL